MDCLFSYKSESAQLSCAITQGCAQSCAALKSRETKHTSPTAQLTQPFIYKEYIYIISRGVRAVGNLKANARENVERFENCVFCCAVVHDPKYQRVIAF